FTDRRPPPFAISWIGVFFLAGAAMLVLAGFTLVHPGTPLDPMWRLNPAAHRELAPYRTVAGALFLALAPIMALTGLGVLYRWRWSHAACQLLIGANLIGDVV